MTQPIAYSRQYSATAWSTNSPAFPQPGVSLDAEFNAIKATLDGLLRERLKIQRDDGYLKNRIVTIDSLSLAALVVLGAGSSWTVKGAWTTVTNYVVSDVISSGTKTYVCAIPHVSGTLATDVAAGKWVLLYDDASSTLEDGIVTTESIADGAVTTAKIGFTALDLVGSIRGQGGIAAGTAATGSLMRAKKDAGDVLVEAERASSGQGEAGFKVIGVSMDWTVGLATSGTALQFKSSGTGVVASLGSTGVLDTTSSRAQGSAVAASGAGAEVFYSSSTGFVQAYDRSGGAWLPIKLRGSTVALSAGGVDIVNVTSAGLDVASGKAMVAGVELGYRKVPRRTTTSSAVAADAAGCVALAAGITIADAVFSAGDAVSFYNTTNAAIAITQGSGLTLRQAGTTSTGNRMLAAYGLATVWFNTASEGVISGAGVY